MTINVADMNEMPTVPMQSFGMTITGPSAPEYEEGGTHAVSRLHDAGINGHGDVDGPDRRRRCGLQLQQEQR